MNGKLKTHVVLDLHYHADEYQGCFDGTKQECDEFVASQTPHFMYAVVPMTKAEIKNHPDNAGFKFAKTNQKL
jgi:hypothetical protein